MKAIGSDGAVWPVRAPEDARRSGTGVLARAAAVLAVAGAALVGLAPNEAPAVSAAAPAADTSALSKEGGRLGASAQTSPHGTTTVPPAIFEARLSVEPTMARFERNADPISTGSLTPGMFRAAAAPSREWREEEFRNVEALDGGTLATGALRIRLAGIALPKTEEICRTLDGRLEPCATRAATQLELLTRSRKVSCRYRMDSAVEAIGTCRVGTTDLAERLLRTGYAKRTAERA
jgi:endonuclease YncB( thermonuclease family)